MIQSLKNPQFRDVYAKGHSTADAFLVMIILPNHREENRLGITVSKKNGNSVVRSRLKRIIKEAYRLNESRILPGYDIVFVARNPSIHEKSTRMERSILNLSRKLRILKPSDGGMTS